MMKLTREIRCTSGFGPLRIWSGHGPYPLADLVHLRGFGPPQTIPFLNGLLELFQFIKPFRYSSGHFHNFSKHLCDKVDATNRSCPYISRWKCNFLQYSVSNTNTQIKTPFLSDDCFIILNCHWYIHVKM